MSELKPWLGMFAVLLALLAFFGVPTGRFGLGWLALACLAASERV